MQYGFVESYNGRFRDELVNEALYSSPRDAREQIRAWQDDHNHRRPYSGLGTIPSAEHAEKIRLEMRAA